MPKAMALMMRGLVRRVHALDVEGGVGLGVAQALRLLQHDVEVQALARASPTG
jgi:hypothetical protein